MKATFLLYATCYTRFFLDFPGFLAVFSGLIGCGLHPASDYF